MHHFKYTLKILFRDKMLIFWTFAFPILLGIFFNLAFKDIEKNEVLDIIDIAVIDNDDLKQNITLKKTIEALSDESSDAHLFNTKYLKEEEALRLLQDNQISGYIISSNGSASLVAAQNGIESTIIKYVLDEISSSRTIADNLIEERLKKASPEDLLNPSALYQHIYEEVITIQNSSSPSIQKNTSHHLSYTMIEYYTLIAMSCLYGGILGLVAISHNLANMSSRGRRSSICPLSKGKTIISSLLASYLVQLLGVAILLAFLYFIIKADFGDNFLYVILLAIAGSLTGLSLGTFLGAVLKTNENTKTSILLSITLFGCFLSGMMGPQIKYLVDKTVPFVNKINPAGLITDGFYSLYYYSSMTRYTTDIITLLIISLILIIISALSLRRQKYDYL